MEDVENEDFLAAYSAEVARLEADLERGEPPTVLRIEESLVLRHGGRRWRSSVLDDAYRSLMRAAHVPALLALDASLAPAARRFAQALRARPRADPAARDLVEQCVALLEAGPPPDWEALRGQLAEPLQRCIQRAAEVELARLDALTRQFLARCGDDARRVRFVVCAGHQPRYRQLSVQYFSALALEDPEREDARDERRVVYAENRSESEALTLLAAQIIDRRLARRLWGDPLRMQEDVLGEAAKRALADFSPAATLPGPPAPAARRRPASPSSESH